MKFFNSGFPKVFFTNIGKYLMGKELFYSVCWNYIEKENQRNFLTGRILRRAFNANDVHG